MSLIELMWALQRDVESAGKKGIIFRAGWRLDLRLPVETWKARAAAKTMTAL